METTVQVFERAGWWRRTLALMVDSLCVAVPSAVAGAALFALTGGYLQWASPLLQVTVCEPVMSVPSDLSPPPPANSNQARQCQFYSIAGPTARILSVTRVSREEGRVTTVSQNYPLLASGQPGGQDLSWISLVALLTLLLGGEWRTGVTPGKRLLGLRVVAADNPERRQVPLRRVVTRYAVAIMGAAAPIGVGLWLVLGPVAAGAQAPSFAPFTLCFSLAFAWMLWNIIRIVRRRPALYDRIARTEVIRARWPAVVRSHAQATPDL